MIYITGDTHAEFTRFSKDRLKAQGLELTEKDYIIVCGDFGLCWAKDGTFKYHCNNFALKPYTILWIQGNHENYDMIAEYPLEEWHGGMVRHIVRDKVILLERGQVFEIEGKTFFTFGGATSHDIQGGVLDRVDEDFLEKKKKAIELRLPFRIRHESWWEQELPTEAEMEEGIRNLERVNFKVDYVLTHCCANSIQEKLEKGPVRILQTDILTDYLQKIKERLTYKHWYFGHYHMDKNVDDAHSLLYHAIVSVEEQKDFSRVPVLGHPRYRWGDIVQFCWNDETKQGKISVVDAYGTFEQNDEPSYDIFVEKENCIYKHVTESMVK